MVAARAGVVQGSSNQVWYQTYSHFCEDGAALIALPVFKVAERLDERRGCPRSHRTERLSHSRLTANVMASTCRACPIPTVLSLVARCPGQNIPEPSHVRLPKELSRVSIMVCHRAFGNSSLEQRQELTLS